MPRKLQVIDLTIQPIEDAPGPEDGIDILAAHSKIMTGMRGCYNYDRIRMCCYWCLADDLLFTDKGVRQGTYKWCSERCRDASEKLHKSRSRGVKDDTVSVE